MNKSEYYNGNDNRNKYYRHVHKLLKEWKIKNNIPTGKKCIVHHRDDNEEVCIYNNEHYELWGFNQDGTFEYGKYVVFMLNADHTTYHHAGKLVSDETKLKISQNHADVCGENNPMYGNIGRITGDKNPMKNEIVRNKVSKALKGRRFSEETRAKMSASKKGCKLSEETKAKMRASRKACDLLWDVYKSNNGILSYKEFRKALKNGDITFEMQPISIFTK